MDKKQQNYTQDGFFPICDPQDFVKTFLTFVPLWCPNFMQKIRKTKELSLRYLKTDQRTDGPRTNGQGRLLRTPSGKPGVQNTKSESPSVTHPHVKSNSTISSFP